MTAMLFREIGEAGKSCIIRLILLAIILGSIAVIGAQVVPSASEYLSIKRTVKQAVTNGGSPTEIRRNFDKISLDRRASCRERV